MSVLPCKENPGESMNLKTLREVSDQDRVLTLMDTFNSPTLNTLGMASKGNYIGPLTPKLPLPEENKPAQEYKASISVKEIQ